LSYKTLNCILPAYVDARGVGDMAAVDVCSLEGGILVVTWPGCSVFKVSLDSADERAIGVSATWLKNTPKMRIHRSTSRSRYSGLLTNLNSFKSVCMYLKWPSPTPFPDKWRNRPIVGGVGCATPFWLCVRHFVFFRHTCYSEHYATGSPIIR